jgi:hypothetical protein
MLQLPFVSTGSGHNSYLEGNQLTSNAGESSSSSSVIVYEFV